MYQPKRVPVLGADGSPLMPTTPRKARLMLRDGIAVPRRNKLGVFHIQMLRPVGTAVQPMVLGVDLGGLHEGLAVASKEGVNICGQMELPADVHKKMETRRNLRRARRHRKTPRRPQRFSNRRRNGYWLAPSQRAKVHARVNTVRELCRIYPVRRIVCEDVRHDPKIGKGARWFSTAEVGKKATYDTFAALAPLRLATAGETAELRERFGLSKLGGPRRPQVFEAQAVDACALAMGEVGCPLGAPLFWVWRRHEFSRRSLHRQNPQRGGVRPRFGGTTNGGFFRKGDWVEVHAKVGTFRGWVCGLPTERTPKVGVEDADGHRIGQFGPRAVRLLTRSGGFSWKEGAALIPMAEARGFRAA
ncbi:MAG: hypothetical protein A2X93_07835 [Deltaproteobacteria bacterium GWC2_56_8]|nr:MAG: hypothetical protein A2X93_07835 [Deltaproteobacteria bacterium GWC2_56_8]